MAPFFSGGGYCSEATYYALSLKNSNISLKIGQVYFAFIYLSSMVIPITINMLLQ